MKTPQTLKEMTKLHLEDHAIVLEMLHTLANDRGKYFVSTEDWSYELKDII